jgi:hypothetical protein
MYLERGDRVSLEDIILASSKTSEQNCKNLVAHPRFEPGLPSESYQCIKLPGVHGDSPRIFITTRHSSTKTQQTPNVEEKPQVIAFTWSRDQKSA